MAMTCDRVREFASGFVLGALDIDEMIAVSDHLDTCSEEHPEIGDLGGVVPYLAETLEPLEPPAWLRESVMAAAQADLAARRHISVEPVAIPTAARSSQAALTWQGPSPVSQGEVIPFAARASRRRRAMTWATRVAAAVAVVVLAGYAVVLQGDLSKSKHDQDTYASLIYAAAQPDTRLAALASRDGSKASGLVALLPTGHIIVNVTNLVPTQGDEAYVVWLTGDNGVQSKVGSFTVSDSGDGYLEVDNVPTSASLYLWVCKEPNSAVSASSGPTIVGGTISL
jgi:hypothetical protein